ncbi:carbon-nitrogen hydrolase [Podospora aff. communis PSN243]|uniref:Carbon-nitrogen hydrolase n=1 Tax=Podospora aff. communis PSN243 TaxID=3040156 RepID=A0AAV9GHF8_9PEZI|nr:carbon-nitrogen hydrolase [Podospora aff. communis PSN243]
MAPRLKISVAQFQPQPCDPEANFNVACSKIRAASVEHSCHIVVLPEYHLTSWAPEHPNFKESCQDAEAYLPRYQELAKELNIHIVPGTIIVQPPGEPAEMRNMAYLIAAGTGDILMSYQKRNLWHPERGVLTAGPPRPHEAFDLPIQGTDDIVRVGLLICWDFAFPEAFRELTILGGAELVIVPAWWHLQEVDVQVRTLNPDSEIAFLDGVAVARAFENTCAVALCNAFGRSQVTMPILGRVGELGPEEGEVVCEIDFQILRYAEKAYKVREDASRRYTGESEVPDLHPGVEER